MLLIVLQILGGVFYLANKVFLALSESRKNKETARKWRIASWIVYLLGLAPWVILFIIKHNWIAASVETSGLPAMVLGLILSLRGSTKSPPKWLDWIALFCIPMGLIYSIYDFNGLNTLTQWLEILLVLGFLVGTYRLAKEKNDGYLWYMLMHVACGWLMLIENFPWLVAQQTISILFIVYAYFLSRKKKWEPST
ncbi:MAG: hypothetical protein ABH817_01995 [archaeon]